VTASSVGEWGLLGSAGWVVFQAPDAAGNPGVVTAVDLETLVNVQVSDPGDPSSTLAGIDGQRVSWFTEGIDEDGNPSSALYARVLGLPGPQLKDRYTAMTSSCDVTWTPVAAADHYEYRIGEAGAIETTTGTSITVTGLQEGTAVPVTVWAVRGDVKSEPQDTFAVIIADRSKLTLSTKSTTVSLKANVTFTAKLTAGSALVTDAPVYLQYSADGTTGWSDVPDGQQVTGANAVVTLLTQAARTLYYRAYYEGDEAHTEAYSPVVKVSAKAAVGTPSFPSSVKKNRTTTAKGVVRPDGFVHPSTSVKIYAYHKEGSKWKLRLTVTAVTTFDQINGTSSYSKGVKLTRTGSWRLYAKYYKSTSIAAANSSSYRSVKVK